MRKSEILVVVKMPGEKAFSKKIDGNDMLNELQKIVGGYIENIDLNDDFSIICNEEGKLNGMPANCVIGNDVVVGPIVVIRNGEEDFVSLKKDDVEKVIKALSGKQFNTKDETINEIEELAKDIYRISSGESINTFTAIVDDGYYDGNVMDVKVVSNLEMHQAVKVAEAIILNMAENLVYDDKKYLKAIGMTKEEAKKAKIKWLLDKFTSIVLEDNGVTK